MTDATNCEASPGALQTITKQVMGTAAAWLDSGLVIGNGERLRVCTRGLCWWNNDPPSPGSNRPYRFSQPEGAYIDADNADPNHPYEPDKVMKTTIYTNVVGNTPPFCAVGAMRTNGSGPPAFATNAVQDGLWLRRDTTYPNKPQYKGRLWLLYNDLSYAYGDNGGSFLILVERVPATLPIIDFFTPPEVATEDVVTIVGSRFEFVEEVTVGSSAASFTVDSLTQITAVVPNGATTGKVSVTNDAGTAYSAYELKVVSGPGVQCKAPNCDCPPKSTQETSTGTEDCRSAASAGVSNGGAEGQVLIGGDVVVQ